MKIVILYSGGLDSYILKKYAEVNHPTAEVKCIYYAHGSVPEKEEIALLPDYVEVRQIEWLNATRTAVSKSTDPIMGAAYVPGRNLVFAVLAASQELPDEIWMGTQFDEVHPRATDKNERFRTTASDVISYVLSPFKDYVNIRFPFVEQRFNKVKAITWALNNGCTHEELGKRISCYFPSNGKPCGVCKSCFKAYLAFKICAIDVEYDQDPIRSEQGRTTLFQYLAWDADPNYVMDRDEANVINMIEQCYPLFDHRTRYEIMKRYPHFENI